MINWNKYPFVRLLLPFATGVWLCLFFTSFRFNFVALYTTMLLLLVSLALVSRYVKNYDKAWIFGAVLAFYLFSTGYAITQVYDEQEKITCFRNCNEEIKAYITRVYDAPEERENSYKVVLEMRELVLDSSRAVPASGKVIAYFSKDDVAAGLAYGDMICFNKPVAEVQPPRNPGEFDYRSYLQRKGIIGQIYLGEDEWRPLNERQANPIYAFSYSFRDKMLASLQNCGIKGDEFGVAAAILLGYDDNLTPELRQSYSAAGSMHILCVSGMHVGIIFLMASFLLGFMDRKKWLKMTKQVILLALIWFYALIAGLSPSIMRASIMISLCIIGDILNRKGFTINSIAASAFILLCINPTNFFEIGFLLSYSAVVGIVVLEKPIYNLVYIKNKRLDKLWEIEAVALAAQIATTPFTIFYFNQFTTYFWLSNIFLTPISFIVVLSGMTLILVSWIPYLNTIVGYVVWGTLYVMDKIVIWIESLPLSIIRGLYISRLELFLLLFTLIAFLLFVTSKSKRRFYAVIVPLAMFVCCFSIRHLTTRQVEEIEFYSLRKHTVIDIVSRGQHVLIADSTLVEDKGTVDFSLAANWYRLSLDDSPAVIGLDDNFDGEFVSKRGNLILFGDKLVALAEPAITLANPIDDKIKIDYLLYYGNNRNSLDRYANLYNISYLVIDGTVPNYLAEKLTQQAEELNIPYTCLSDNALICKRD